MRGHKEKTFWIENKLNSIGRKHFPSMQDLKNIEVYKRGSLRIFMKIDN